MNPREREARGKDAVDRVTACYVDIDLPEGTAQEDALAEVLSGEAPAPSFVVNSGYTDSTSCTSSLRPTPPPGA
jgi:hypothetical protein